MAVIEGEYTCEICGKTFETNVAIAAHTRTHEYGTTEDEVLSEIQGAVDQLGRVPTSNEFNRNASISTTLVTAEFDSWAAAVQAAGYQPRAVYKSDEEILEKIQDVAATVGHVPTNDEMEENSSISASTIQNHFGTWNAAVEAAGLEPNRRVSIQPDAILEAIQALAAELGRAPTSMEMEDQGDISVNVAQRVFGSWNSALEEAGFEPHTVRDIPKKVLLDEIRWLEDELGYVPSSVDFREQGEYALKPYFRHWNTWKGAVEAAGFEYRGFVETLNR